MAQTTGDFRHWSVKGRQLVNSVKLEEARNHPLQTLSVKGRRQLVMYTLHPRRSFASIKVYLKHYHRFWQPLLQAILYDFFKFFLELVTSRNSSTLR